MLRRVAVPSADAGIARCRVGVRIAMRKSADALYCGTGPAPQRVKEAHGGLLYALPRRLRLALPLQML